MSFVMTFGFQFNQNGKSKKLEWKRIDSDEVHELKKETICDSIIQTMAGQGKWH